MSVSIHPRYDEAKINDADLQHLLKAHIEKETGRRVIGDVVIHIDDRFGQAGNSRVGKYTAQCELAAKP